jgi:hypothetical protein
MGDDIEGAMQQAPQRIRQSIQLYFCRARYKFFIKTARTLTYLHPVHLGLIFGIDLK